MPSFFWSDIHEKTENKIALPVPAASAGACFLETLTGNDRAHAAKDDQRWLDFQES